MMIYFEYGSLLLIFFFSTAVFPNVIFIDFFRKFLIEKAFYNNIYKIIVNTYIFIKFLSN